MLWGYDGVFPGQFKVWDGDKPINQLRFAAEHGFGATSIGLGELEKPDRRDLIASIVDENNLQLSTHARVPWFDENEDTVKAAIDKTIAGIEQHSEAINLCLVTIVAGKVHRFMAEPSLEKQLDLLAQRIAPLAKYCQERGLPIGIENHGDYYCSDLVDLCKRTPGLGIFLDTGNCYLIGEATIPACLAAIPYTVGTHLIAK